MRIEINTECINPFKVDNEESSFEEMNRKLMDMIIKKNIDINEYSISNRRLRGTKHHNGYEFHILEKPCEITPIYCVGNRTDSPKRLLVDLPYTIMILRLKYSNGEYRLHGDRIFHSDKPVKEDLSNSLWSWSLSNVYSSHDICWGANKDTLPRIDVQTSYKLMDIFFSSTMNHDLITGRKIEGSPIDWKAMATDKVYKVELNRDTKKLPKKLSDVIYNF